MATSWTYAPITAADDSATSPIGTVGGCRHAPVHGTRISGAHLEAPTDRVVLEPTDPKLDYITHLAVMTAGADIGGISLIYQDQIWLPSRVGVSSRLLPRAGSFCSCAIQEDEAFFEVTDARRDLRFANNPLVSEPPHYLHYAAVPLHGRSSYLLGTLWVMSHASRSETTKQVAELQLLARIVVDILELRYFEPATGMFNRTVFLQHLEYILERTHERITVGFIDLAGFRQINDLYGRQAGDTILAHFGERLELWGGDGALLAHLGGDRFAFALAIPDDQVKARLDELVRAVDQPFIIGDGYTHTLHARIGINRPLRQSALAASDVLDAADSAAASIYRRHNHSVVCHQDAVLHKRNRLRNELGRAIQGDSRHGALVVHFQPQFDVSVGSLTGLEALVRWRHPQFGLIGPLDFIPQAEASGYIFELDMQVLQLVCATLREWLDSGVAPVPVALNFSRASLLHTDFASRMAATLQQAGVPGALLELEVTESVLLDALQPLHASIAMLRDQGIRIAIDDFGTGASNLDSLDNFPFDRLKVDRKFVHGVSTDSKKASLFALIQGVAKIFNANLVCEGVEDVVDLDWLTRHGACCVQGWLFSRARDASNIQNVLARFRAEEGRKLSVSKMQSMLVS